MSKCTQCPYAMGDAYKRDCSFPDCMGGWEQAYKDLIEERDHLREQLRQTALVIQNLEKAKLKVASVIQDKGTYDVNLQIIKCYETDNGVIIHVT